MEWIAVVWGILLTLGGLYAEKEASHEQALQVEERVPAAPAIEKCGDVVFSTLGPSSDRRYFNEDGERCMASKACQIPYACKASA